MDPISSTVSSIFGGGGSGNVNSFNDVIAKVLAAAKAAQAAAGAAAEVQSGLAPSFGSLNKESIKTLDEKLKVMIGTVHDDLVKIPPAELTFDKAVEVLTKNQLLQLEGQPIHRTDGIRKGGTNAFKFDRGTDSGIVREVHTWFVNLIGDDDVVKACGFTIDSVADIVATSGASIDSFESFFSADNYTSKNVLNVGILRYPDVDQPHFKLFRIQLNAWSKTSRILFVSDESSGLNGNYQMSIFKPNDAQMAILSAETKQLFIDDAEKMFQ
ncbi:hypothetical protein SCHPADRAFT_734493 [Schizopora paradoxa]|uniref:Uncharacterized protein n=1 Tax=Schizopora paradoxa TaxID=27342 RepID=A0A0H2RK59_9AGAM|nr:hypothetical protein SCHPADRAFT_734493 [Schizopora paradoxa]